MKHNLEKRLESLEARTKPPDSADTQQELDLMEKVLAAHYDGQELQLTPEQEQMLRDTIQWYRDEGLYYLLGGDNQ